MIIEKKTYQCLSEELPKKNLKKRTISSKSYKLYKLDAIDVSRIHGYIRERKIRKNPYEKNGLVFEYAPIIVDSGIIEVGDGRKVVHISGTGTHRTVGRVPYKKFDEFVSDFKARKCGLMFAGGTASVNGQVCDESLIDAWNVYIVFGENK